MLHAAHLCTWKCFETHQLMELLHKNDFNNCPLPGNQGSSLKVSFMPPTFPRQRFGAALEHELFIVRGARCWEWPFDAGEPKYSFSNRLAQRSSFLACVQLLSEKVTSQLKAMYVVKSVYSVREDYLKSKNV
ncbi:hypothetical protein TNIN_370031 [Trichonephila inaurata madagascariensis]|uniref:Uncharacterized protein n=1 Tax=Trichonephila inaurata madagascariensis TaxID=2747483 RepID=A0A8X6X868_9ARAC|nr:hypothetical protein TNIN_370031 [Trichonephila inaurata madagascariensis]